MPTTIIPTGLTFAVSLILAFHGFTLFTAPKTLIELAVKQAMEQAEPHV